MFFTSAIAALLLATVPETAAVTSANTDAVHRPRVSDPWNTRGTLSMTAAQTTFSATIPAAGADRHFAGAAQGGVLAIDLYGRRLGFDLLLAGSQAALANPDPAAPIPRAASGEASAAFTGVILNSRGIFLAAGPGVEARATMAGALSADTNAAATSWQTAVAGGALHARVFVGPHVYLTGHGFAGAVALSGHWQSVDAAQILTSSSAGTAPIESGTLRDPAVYSGSLAASVRPVEWIALSGGVAARDASFATDGGHAREHGVRPFLGIELLY